MQQNLTNFRITYLVGNSDIILKMKEVRVLAPFDAAVIDFMEYLSKLLMKSREAKLYPDVVTLGFWLRKASILALKERFIGDANKVNHNGSTSSRKLIQIGRGVAFHIAPSNVAVNYAYSLFAGLLTGNANIVRIPSKEFPQVSIINHTITQALEAYPEIKNYICLVRYDRNQDINDYFSAMADTRIIWGGDRTIEEIRKSPLGPRASEITFADRYSFSVINSEQYLLLEDKNRFAEAFYNDTYLSDQNACTSPRLVVWTGKKKQEAKDMFWNYVHALVKEKYPFQPIMGINKLTSMYLVAAQKDGIRIEKSPDNYIVRIHVSEVDAKLMEFKDNSGFFFEYDCDDILTLRDFCNNTHCQTLGLLGETQDVMPLLTSGIKGIDRVVPIGKTMDFDLIWDGYQLVERLTRTIQVY